MRILLLGSIAYDNIMVFEGRFREHILPDQIHMLNVAFLVPALRREFGGCAANIAYNLRMLGGEPLIMATVGEDAEPYYRRLDALGIARTHVREVAGTYTAQAFITTDLDDNQITAFHPGAMGHSHLNNVAAAGEVIEMRRSHRPGMKGGDLVVIQIRGDESLRRVCAGDFAHVRTRDTERVQPSVIGFSVLAHGGHDQRLAAEHAQIVGDIGSTAAEFAPQSRHQEGYVEHVDLVGQDVLAETTLEHHNVVVGDRAQ